jgi:hypothetical protein
LRRRSPAGGIAIDHPGSPVAARNSTFGFKGQSLDVRQIGVQLGVEYVVEGSVRRGGGRVRVPGRDNPNLHPISGGDADGLMAKLDAARKRVAKVSGQTPKVILFYEAGYDGFWLARPLEQHGIECRVETRSRHEEPYTETVMQRIR